MERDCRRCGDFMAWMSDGSTECVRCGLNSDDDRSRVVGKHFERAEELLAQIDQMHWQRDDGAADPIVDLYARVAQVHATLAQQERLDADRG